MLLELEEDREVGDLNSALLTHKFFRGDLEGVTVEVLLPKWDKENEDLLAFAGSENLTSLSVANPELKKTYWQGDLTINFKVEGSNRSIGAERCSRHFHFQPQQYRDHH